MSMCEYIWRENTMVAVFLWLFLLMHITWLKYNAISKCLYTDKIAKKDLLLLLWNFRMKMMTTAWNQYFKRRNSLKLYTYNWIAKNFFVWVCIFVRSIPLNSIQCTHDSLSEWREKRKGIEPKKKKRKRSAPRSQMNLKSSYGWTQGAKERRKIICFYMSSEHISTHK